MCVCGHGQTLGTLSGDTKTARTRKVKVMRVGVGMCVLFCSSQCVVFLE